MGDGKIQHVLFIKITQNSILSKSSSIMFFLNNLHITRFTKTQVK